LDVDCYRISSANIDGVRSCFTEIQSEYYKADGVYDPIIGTEIENIFLTMDTSYGAELVVICEAVEEADLWFQDLTSKTA
jgi:hypothetical protein